MGAKDLLAKIEALPEEKRAELESILDSLTAQTGVSTPRSPKSSVFPPGLIDRINARRQALLKEHGPFDSLPLIREFRDTGGR